MFFSVILPVYDREPFIVRCLDSVLSQDFADFEIVAVDDGSQDGSLARLRSYSDPRLRVLAHETNQGVSPARNTAIDAATGKWLVFLDSDDELVTGALTRIHQVIAASDDGIDGHWFRCRLDDGTISPASMPANRNWDYEGFLNFLDHTVGGWRDALRVERRDCFTTLRYPKSRMLGGKHHLDFARRFRRWGHDDVLRLYHQDADNQLTKYQQRLDPERDRDFLNDRAEGLAAVVAEHGAGVRRRYPRLYAEHLQQAAAGALAAGRRGAALGYSLRLIAQRPGLAKGWVLLAAIPFGQRALALKRRFAR
jgi:glycosyltransferase involved in cell wall biosynthesis